MRSNHRRRYRYQKKRFKIFEYFRDKISSNGVKFLHETHYSEDIFSKKQDDAIGVLLMILLRTNILNVKAIRKKIILMLRAELS